MSDQELWRTWAAMAVDLLAMPRSTVSADTLWAWSNAETPSQCQPDNPSPGSPIYSTGLRDPQGFDWQPDSNALYATDHGDNGNNEVNRIERGANYGWPDIEGTQQQEGMKTPWFIFVVAPSGAAFYRSNRIKEWSGSLFIACLKAERLNRVV